MLRAFRRYAVLASSLSLVACGAAGLAITNPLVSGKVEPNRVLTRHADREERREIPADSAADEAVLSSLDAQQICFEATLRSLPDTDDVIDIHAAEISLSVDGKPVTEAAQLTASNPEPKSYPGLVPSESSKAQKQCAELVDGVCVRYDEGTVTEVEWTRGDVIVMESRGTVCFPHAPVTAATRKLALEMSIRVKDDKTLTGWEAMTGKGVKRLTFAWELKNTISAN